MSENQNTPEWLVEARKLRERQEASTRVTETPRECECPWCVNGPRRSGVLLVNFDCTREGGR